jgi:hypothetical protein
MSDTKPIQQPKIYILISPNPKLMRIWSPEMRDLLPEGELQPITRELSGLRYEVSLHQQTDEKLSAVGHDFSATFVLDRRRDLPEFWSRYCGGEASIRLDRDAGLSLILRGIVNEFAFDVIREEVVMWGTVTGGR